MRSTVEELTSDISDCWSVDIITYMFSRVSRARDLASCCPGWLAGESMVCKLAGAALECLLS